jgi:hypothetical protein
VVDFTRDGEFLTRFAGGFQPGYMQINSPGGTVENVDPTALDPKARVFPANTGRLSVLMPAGPAAWGGLKPGYDGQLLIIINDDPNGFGLTLNEEDTSSSPAWRFAGSATIASDFALQLVYNANNVNRWRIISLVQSLPPAPAPTYTQGFDVVLAAGANNDVAPGISTSGGFRIRFTAPAGIAQVTGISGPGQPGQPGLLINNDAANLITFLINNAGSFAADRFFGASDLTLQPKASVAIVYDDSLSNWVIVSPT